MFNRIPILTQLIAGFSLILLVLMSATGYFTYKYSSQVVLENTSRYLNESILQMGGKIDGTLKEYDKLSQIISFSSLIQQYMTEINETGKSGITRFEVERYVASQTRFLVSDYMFHLMDNRGGYYPNTNNNLYLFWRTEDELRAQPWYPIMDQYDGRIVWFAGKAWNNGVTTTLIGARQLKNWDSMDKIGHMFIIFPVEEVQRIIGESDLQYSGKIQLVDSFGNIVFSSNRSEVGMQAESSLLAGKTDPGGAMVKTYLDGKPYYLSNWKSEYSGLTVIAYIDAKEAVKNLWKVRNSTLLIGLLGLVAAMLFTVFFSWSLARPIHLLAMRLGHLEKGMMISTKVPLRNYEVTKLYESFHNMIEHLKSTVKALSDKQISEQRAQLIAMRAQFRPHFLYNSLNTIYWKLMSDGQQESADIVLTVSDLLRYSIQPGSDMVTVREDLDQLKRYLTIIKARYGDKLQPEITVDEHLLENKMMKMLLQPLVENAVTHGLESVKGKPWIIRLHIVERDGQMHFVIEDNGKGMSEEEMAKALTLEETAVNKAFMHTGIGLANINNRIALTYGRQYGLALSRSELGGLKVHINLPLDQCEGGIRDETAN